MLCKHTQKLRRDSTVKTVYCNIWRQDKITIWIGTNIFAWRRTQLNSRSYLSFIFEAICWPIQQLNTKTQWKSYRSELLPLCRVSGGIKSGTVISRTWVCCYQQRRLIKANRKISSSEVTADHSLQICERKNHA